MVFVYFKTADSAHNMGVLLSVTCILCVCQGTYKTKPVTEKGAVVTIDIQDVGAIKKTEECLIG